MRCTPVTARQGRYSDSLNLIRLLAALQVLYEHTLAHLHIADLPVLGTFLHFFHGVPIFFTLSGFLIWQSVGRSGSPVSYLQKRFWRIYPELWVAVAVELVVLLCLYAAPIHWLSLGVFAITQGTFFPFWTPDWLRGYGCGCPNGSLWTICVLIQFYLTAYPMYKFLHGRKLWIWGATFLLTLAIGLALPTAGRFLPLLATKLLKQSLLPYLWMFVLSAFVAEKRATLLPFLTAYWWVPVLATIAVQQTHVDIAAAYPVLETVLLFLGLTGAAYRFPQLNLPTDISYGVYIYHMTVVNALIALGYEGQTGLLFVVAALTCMLAWVSTKTVGAWSARRKKLLASTR